MTTLAGRMRTQSDFYYPGGGRDQILDRMRERFIANPGLVLLSGDQGSGRSRFLHTLINSFSRENSDGCLLSENDMRLETEEQLFQALAVGFGLEQKTLEIFEALKERVEHFLSTRLQDKHTVFILVDEAVRHSQEVITRLLVLASKHEGLNLLLVVAQDELPNALEHFQIQALAIDCVDLRPLQPEESVDFLQRHLQFHEVREKFAPNADWTVALMNKTQGNLALLEQEAQQRLPKHLLLKKNAADFPKGHLIAFVMVVLLTTLVFFYFPSQTKQRAADSDLSDTSADTQDATDAVDDDASHEPDTALTDTTSEPDQANDPVGVEAAAAQSGLAPSQVVSSAVEASVPVLAETPTPHPVESTFTPDEQALLHMAAEGFTLQIANLLTEKQAGALIEQWTNNEQPLLHYYRRKHGSRISYVVVYGDYPDKQTALSAVHTPHETLGKFSPWPRRLAEIQQELKHRQP